MAGSDSDEDSGRAGSSPEVVRLASLLDAANGAWVLTGAGMSTESGLPDYRGPAGMWRDRSFAELASIDAMRREPREFWDFYRVRLDHLGEAQPNDGHHALARLQRAGIVERVVTQNVDGLHQLAGNEDVLELHGSLRVARCRSCGIELPIAIARERWATAADAVPMCDCGEVIGPGVVLFGEALPLAIDVAFDVAARCDVALALGTSLEVFPAAHLPLVTLERGGRLGIVNDGSTQFDELATIRIDGRLGTVLPAVADELLGTDD